MMMYAILHFHFALLCKEDRIFLFNLKIVIINLMSLLLIRLREKEINVVVVLGHFIKKITGDHPHFDCTNNETCNIFWNYVQAVLECIIIVKYYLFGI